MSNLKKSLHRAFALLLIFPFFLVISSCSSEKGNWENAKSKDTIEAYEGFQKNYPNGEFLKQAAKRLTELYFKKAAAADTIEAYETFQKKYPASEFAEQINNKLSALYFKMATSANTVDAFKDYIKKFPVGELSRQMYGMIQEKLFHFRLEYSGLFPVKGSSDAFRGKGTVSYRGNNNTIGGGAVLDICFWKFTNTKNVKSVALVLKVTIHPKPQILHSSQLELRYMVGGNQVQALCSGFALLGYDRPENKVRDLWIINKRPDKGVSWNLELTDYKNVNHYVFLFEIPRETSQASLFYSGELVEKDIALLNSENAYPPT